MKVNYLNTQSGPRSKQLLAAKQIGAATTGANDWLRSRSPANNRCSVYTFDVRVPFANILINKEVYDFGVKSIDKLAGRSVGITAPQSATWLMAVYITERAGLKDKVAIRPLGDFTTMMGAVKSKGVDACMATYAMLEKAKEEGWGVPLFEITDAAAWDKVFGGALPVRRLMFSPKRSRNGRATCRRWSAACARAPISSSPILPRRSQT